VNPSGFAAAKHLEKRIKPAEWIMPESQLELFKEIHENYVVFGEHQPEVAQGSADLAAEVYKDGELRGRDKRLMALCAALVSGCRACILFQTRQALELGASAAEILETCGVAVSLGGTMAAGESCRVVAYLRERGLI
jgi:AhpD family alkylhydroperoxidase